MRVCSQPLHPIWGTILGEKIQTLGERLREARGEESRDTFAQLFGIHRNTLARWESGERSPDVDFLRAVAENKGLSLEWLLTGKGDQHPNGCDEPRLTSVPMMVSDCDVVMVPKVQARLSAGGGSLEANSDPVGNYAFRSDWLCRKGQAASMVLMDVVGDSMSPAIEDGDMVLIDQSQTGVVPGAIYAVGIEDGVYVKRLDLLPGTLVLNSINPAYSPIQVPLRGDLADTVRVIGRIIWWCREAN